MNTDERKKIASDFFEEIETIMSNLYARWQDEKDYEDITDYGDIITQHVDHIGGTFLTMKKRPFGFTYKLSNATYQVMVRATNYEYKRIA